MKKYNLLLKAFVAIVAIVSIGLSAFAYSFEAGGIYYNITISTNKTVEVTSGSSLYSGSVTIPSAVTYNETTYSVTKIGDQAFNDCSGLTKVTIPNSVRLIGSNAFRNCTNLKNANIGNSVTMIGFMAFDGCSSLTSVTIPNSVTTIGTGAFRNCSSLTKVTIPNSVTKIGESTLCHCPGLTSIVVESGNPYYDSRENCNAIIESSTNTLIAGYKNTYIPNSVTAIGVDAFNDCSGLTEVTIPNSVTAIGSFAFRNCTSLSEVNIPNFVTTIGDYAFRGCSGLTSVTIPNSVTSIGDYAFWDCSRLTEVTSLNPEPPTCGSGAFSGSYSAILKVPEGTKDAYANAPEWKKFTNIQEIAGVEDVEVDNNAVEVGRYDIHGHQLSEPTKGVNIIKMSDGSIRKELMK